MGSLVPLFEPRLELPAMALSARPKIPRRQLRPCSSQRLLQSTYSSLFYLGKCRSGTDRFKELLEGSAKKNDVSKEGSPEGRSNVFIFISFICKYLIGLLFKYERPYLVLRDLQCKLAIYRSVNRQFTAV